MKSTNSNQKRTETARLRALLSLLVALAVLCACVSFIPIAGAQNTASATARGKAFASAQEAADALVSAAETYDEAALTQILGPDAFDIIHTGESARDKENSQAFAAQARTKMNLQMNKLKTSATIVV